MKDNFEPLVFRPAPYTLGTYDTRDDEGAVGEYLELCFDYFEAPRGSWFRLPMSTLFFRNRAYDHSHANREEAVPRIEKRLNAAAGLKDKYIEIRISPRGPGFEFRIVNTKKTTPARRRLLDI